MKMISKTNKIPTSAQTSMPLRSTFLFLSADRCNRECCRGIWIYLNFVDTKNVFEVPALQHLRHA